MTDAGADDLKSFEKGSHMRQACRRLFESDSKLILIWFHVLAMGLVARRMEAMRSRASETRCFPIPGEAFSDAHHAARMRLAPSINSGVTHLLPANRRAISAVLIGRDNRNPCA